MSDQRELEATLSGRPVEGSLSSPPSAGRSVFGGFTARPGRPLLRDEESRLAESFERSRQAFAELICGLPGPLRERVLDGDPDGASLGSRWPLAELEVGFDRLVRLARPVELPPETLRRARRLKRRIEHTRESLIVANLGLVYLLAHKSRGRGIPFSDLVQEGTLGLIRAVERFDRRRDCRLSSYAHWWVRKSIHAAFDGNLRTIRLPRYARDRLRKLRSVDDELRRLLGRRPTPGELARRLNLPEAKIYPLVAAASDAQSFDNFEDGTEYLGFLACSAPDPLERAIVEQSHVHLRRAIAKLRPREARVVRLRFGIDAGDPRTLKQIAELLGVSRERVRQIEAEALEKLRGVVRKEPLGEAS